jgi:predicted nucleic acid-binding protein
MLRKQRIYLDTSVISYLDQQDSPEKMAETQKFWELVKKDEFDVFIRRNNDPP